MPVAKITSDFLNTVPVYMFRGQDVTLGSERQQLEFSTGFCVTRDTECAVVCLNPV